jgi:hypothetical protein
MFTATVLATAQPKPAPKSVTLLKAHLADDRNSPIDCANIVQSLIASFPSDPAMRQRILSFVERNSIWNVTLAALNGLHRVEYLDPDSLEFIGSAAPVRSLARLQSICCQRETPQFELSFRSG